MPDDSLPRGSAIARRRADVLRMTEEGMAPADIATTLGIRYEAVIRDRATLGLRASKAAAPVTPATKIEATPATAWDFVHWRGLSIQAAARRMGVSLPEVFELLAAYRPVAEAHRRAAARAIAKASAT
ncbi:conserved protein of unknown function (plasmid) [Rhodovastum atsumiense]|uniref:Helix-turn-helix domain-containing protein n=1 Tax=Rhodovastum atsumiense TaxID=504468 RepID=A0A5M6IWI9_9PROT|nr:hypothetical protein [Rhodovastum atsumiense]KAA5611828.1 hypothetical protein F1189_12380 [Rhodovastum atsumiense]CAH2606061.1 conserved protein of unknown function [Rhodovastum atsumiense]